MNNKQIPFLVIVFFLAIVWLGKTVVVYADDPVSALTPTPDPTTPTTPVSTDPTTPTPAPTTPVTPTPSAPSAPAPTAPATPTAPTPAPVTPAAPVVVPAPTSAPTPTPTPAPTPDTIAPVITLLGDATVSILQGSVYKDAGATALDDVDGDCTSKIIVTGSVDTSAVGTYILTYAVHDAVGNAATVVTRAVTVTTPVVVPTETVLIRNGNTLIYQGIVDLPAQGTVSILDDTGVSHTINADSTLGVLYSISKTSGLFSLSDIAYYSSFNSLYLKCLTLTDGVQSCDNWQYVVNGTTPLASMDSTVLSGGEKIGFYFGSSHQVVFTTQSVSTS